MRKVILLAVLALPVIILLTLPVSLILPHLDAPEALDQARGTIWSGQANWNQPGHVPLNVSWRWSGGRYWRFQAGDGETGVHGRWKPGRTIRLEDLSGRLALNRVDLEHWFFATRPAGYLALDIPSARIGPGRVPEMTGRVIWEDARLEGAIHERLGRIAIDLEPGPDRLQARISALEPGPLRIQGRIEADAVSYMVDVWLRADPDRPDLAGQISQLGERQADGQVRIRLRGSLGW